MHKHTAALVGMGILALGITWLVSMHRNAAEPAWEMPATSTARVMSIEDYMRANISSVSPVREQLGGTFYVTGVRAANGTGTVSYEDGHNAYEADFGYISDPEKGITITSFTMRK